MSAGGPRTGVGWVAGVIAAAFAYALVRYVALKGTPWSEVPLFIANKAVSLAGLALAGLSIAGRSRGLRRRAGLGGGALVLLHLLLTLPLLSATYYPALFSRGEPARLTGEGQLALLAGALALTALAIVARPSSAADRLPWERFAPAAIVALGALHCLILGWRGWIDLARWPGRLPPITLVAFACALAALAAAAWGRRRRRAAHAAAREPHPRGALERGPR